MTLEQVQSDFKRFLFDGDERIVASVADTPRLDARSRLHIYATAYRARLTEALRGDYPILCATLGETPFAELCVQYIAAHPSRSFTLRGLGRWLPRFVEAQTHLANRSFAAELAAFEWALVDAFDAPDRGVARIDDMARVEADAWPALRFDVHSSVQIVETRFNTMHVWNAIKANAVPPDVVELEAPTACVIWRRDLTTMFRSIQPDELIAWRVLADGGDFASMCAALLDRLTPDQIPMRSAMLLRGWLAEGLIAELYGA